MAVDYPIDSLPYPVRDNFSSKYGQPFRLVQMDDAHNRIRRRFGAQPFEHSITFEFTWDEFDYWEAFLRYDCAQASGYFNLALAPGQATRQFRLKAYPQSTFSAAKGKWVVSCNVEWIRTKPTGYDNAPSSLPVWPSSLPYPEKDNFQISREDTVTRSNLDLGLASERSRFKDEVAKYNVTWLFTASEYSTFDSFAHNQLLGGLAPFKAPFANGQGAQLVRANMTDITVSENGAAYKVSATLELRDIPVMSEAHYRGWDNLQLADTITFGAGVVAQFGTNQHELFAYTDAVQFLIKRPIADNITFGESITSTFEAYRTFNETYSFSEAPSFYIAPAPFNDTVKFKATGQICKNDYSDNTYFLESYVATCADLSIETEGNDIFGFGESIGFVWGFNKTLTENVSLTTVGKLLTQQYVGYDYVGWGYTADTAVSF